MDAPAIPKYILDSFTEAEKEAIANHYVLETQLRNLNRVMSSSITGKKLRELEQNDLPQLLIKVRNAEGKASQIMKKKGFERK